ncbi:MAG TPA: HRDC domain-containing protein, partial [Saprospiraceae bacterium]|nr:HRDC domain-containing protein [Saprospiraceae bacterium]
MQIKIFSIPVMGGEALAEEMNAFLRSRKILQVEQQLVQEAHGALWCFCVRYIEGEVYVAKEKTDYKDILEPEAFTRFVAMKGIRKKLADEEGIRAYNVFTDAELAELARLEQVTAASMKKVKGIGEKKVEKYGKHFFSSVEPHEKSQQSDTADSRS